MTDAQAPRRMASPSGTAEHERIASAPAGRPGEWKAIGPYVSERAWGTVREDYSADGEAWQYFPYEHGRSRAYRWNEDGLAGLCDLQQHMCFALAFWNGRDPFLKERIFGLGSPEGNHGEDAKEYWWYVDATPTASWLSWRYHYPQDEFPYARLRAENARRGKGEGEFELVDTGVFDGGPLLADHRRLREGGAARRVPARPRAQCRSRGGRAARAAHAVVPEPVVVGGRGHASVAPRGRRSTGRDRRRGAPGALAACSRPRSRGPAARIAVLRERHERRASLRRRAANAVSQGRHQRSRRERRRDGESRAAGNEDGVLVSPRRCGRRDGRAAPAPRARRLGRVTRPRRRVRSHARRAPPRSRRVLRHPATRERDGRRGRSHAPGLCRHDLEPAVLPLRRRALARRRSGGAAAARGAEERAQRRLAPPEQPRPPRDARQVGVPLVRRMGSRVPLRGPRAHRSGGGEAPAPAHGPRVVHASERAAPGLRVELRRRESARRGVGGARRVPDRRRDRPRVPGARLPQAPDQLHLVGEPQGRARRQHFRGRLPRSGQHRAVRPVGDAARGPGARAVRRHGLDGEVLPQHARDGAAAGQPRPGVRGCRGEVLRAFRIDRRGDERALGRAGRLLLRPAAQARRLDVHGARALDGRTAPALRGGRAERVALGAAARTSARGRAGSSTTIRS